MSRPGQGKSGNSALQSLTCSSNAMAWCRIPSLPPTLNVNHSPNPVAPLFSKILSNSANRRQQGRISQSRQVNSATNAISIEFGTAIFHHASPIPIPQLLTSPTTPSRSPPKFSTIRQTGCQNGKILTALIRQQLRPEFGPAHSIRNWLR